MTDAAARKLIASAGLKGPVARAVAHILRRYKDAEGTMKALKAIIVALKEELSALVPDEKTTKRKPVVCYREQWPTKAEPFARHARLDN